MPNNSGDLFWQVPIAALYDRVDRRAAGLSAAETAKRLEQFGTNAFSPIASSFGFVGIPATLIAVIAALAVTYLLASEFMKTFATRDR